MWVIAVVVDAVWLMVFARYLVAARQAPTGGAAVGQRSRQGDAINVSRRARAVGDEYSAREHVAHDDLDEAAIQFAIVHAAPDTIKNRPRSPADL